MPCLQHRNHFYARPRTAPESSGKEPVAGGLAESLQKGKRITTKRKEAKSEAHSDQAVPGA
eukprot:558233-Rhodomonas_salina.3